MNKTYLFSVGPSTPPMMIIDAGDEVEVTVEGAFEDVDDINSVPTPFTPECEGHPLAPIAGPIAVRGAKPGDSVAIEIKSMQPEPSIGRVHFDTTLGEPSERVWGIMAITRLAPTARSTASPGAARLEASAEVQWLKLPLASA